MISRVVGLALAVVLLLTYEPGAPGMVNRIALPALLVLAGWLALRSAVALALAVTLLAGIHSVPGAADPYSGIVYPAIAAVSAATALVLLVSRFRRRVNETRAARWSERSASGKDHEIGP